MSFDPLQIKEIARLSNQGQGVSRGGNSHNRRKLNRWIKRVSDLFPLDEPTSTLSDLIIIGRAGMITKA